MKKNKMWRYWIDLYKFYYYLSLIKKPLTLLNKFLKSIFLITFFDIFWVFHNNSGPISWFVWSQIVSIWTKLVWFRFVEFDFHLNYREIWAHTVFGIRFSTKETSQSGLTEDECLQPVNTYVLLFKCFSIEWSWRSFKYHKSIWAIILSFKRRIVELSLRYTVRCF